MTINVEGKFLVATKKVLDPEFAGKVIFIKVHNDEGATGIIANGHESGNIQFTAIPMDNVDENPTQEELEKHIKENFDPSKLDTVPIYHGGPVRTPGVYMLHNHGDCFGPGQESEYDLGIDYSEQNEIPEQARVGKNLFMGDPQVLTRILENNKKGFRFFKGCCEWSPGQLETELNGGAWKIFDSDPEIILDLEEIEYLLGPKKQLAPSIN